MPIQDPASKFGVRLEKWYEALPIISWLIGYESSFGKRVLDVHHWMDVRGYALMSRSHISWLSECALAVVYVYSGLDLIDIKHPTDPGLSIFLDPSQFMGDALESAFANPVTREITQTLGALVTGPVLASLEVGLAQAQTDPMEAARAFHGTVAAISASTGILNTAVEAASGGQIDNAGQVVSGLYWNLGLGFLGWQTLAPLLENGLQPPLRAYYLNKYRPERFSSSQMSDLFAMGKVSADDLRNHLRAIGWRDNDVSQWIDLSYRNLGEGDVWKLYKDGVLTKSQVESRLRIIGYNPADIPLVFKANEPDAVGEAKDVLLSTAKSAYLSHLISADDYGRILRDQKRPEEEIRLSLALLDIKKAGEQADFNRSEIRQLYNTRVIASPEAITYLIKTGLSGAQAELLLQAWEAADVPEAIRINQSTVREAFTDGVLTRAQAKERLNQLGYTAADAELIVLTWETEAAPKRLIPGPTGAGALTLNLLSQMAAARLITESAMRTRPELERYDEADRERIVTLMYQAPSTGIAELAESVLVDAYRFGIISREQLVARFVERGLSETDTDLALQVIDAQIAEERTGEIVGTIKRPSVGSLQLALQRQIITEEQFVARMIELGFNDDAIRLYALNAQYQSPAKPKDLTTAQILNLYKDADIVRSEAQYRLIKDGYTVNDAQLLIKNLRLTPADTEVGEAYIMGMIDGQGAFDWLSEQQFTEDEIGAFFDEYPPT